METNNKDKYTDTLIPDADSITDTAPADAPSSTDTTQAASGELHSTANGSIEPPAEIAGTDTEDVADVAALADDTCDTAEADSAPPDLPGDDITKEADEPADRDTPYRDADADEPYEPADTEEQTPSSEIPSERRGEAIADDENKDSVPALSDNGQGSEKRRMIDTVFDFVELFVFTLVTVLIITSFFVRQSVVDGISMEGTLHGGDNLLISDFMYEPKGGDIIVCEDFSKFNKPIVKRVIATEGQTVRFTEDTVYVDGVALDEPYVHLSNPVAFSYLESFTLYYNLKDDFWAKEEKYGLKYKEGEYYEVTVPEGELFVMGDHRDNSEDSRARGTMKVDSVLGKVLVRFYPFDSFGAVE